jgi:hypothetical protein
LIIPYKPEHALAIKLQEWQKDICVTPENAEVLSHGLCAWTCLNDATRAPVACAGLLPVWEHRALAWSLISRDAGRSMNEITRKILEVLDECTFRRIEMYVRPGFHEAFRWAVLLGFEFEAVLEAADPAGGDMVLFKRVKR